MIQFNIYDRADENHEFIGCVKVKPTLVHDYAVDQWYKYVPLIFASSSSLIPPRLGPYENESNITGEIRIQVTFEQNKVVFLPFIELCTISTRQLVETITDTTRFRVP